MAINNERVEKTRRIKVIFFDYVPAEWSKLQDIELIIAVGPKAGPGLLTFYHDNYTVILGVPREDHVVYLSGVSETTWIEKGWLWGHAVESYDGCLDYLGAGPIFLLCWPPVAKNVLPIRTLGKAARVLADVVDRALDWCESRCPSVLNKEVRFKAWLTVNWLSRQASGLDAAPCGHRGCVPGRSCKIYHD